MSKKPKIFHLAATDRAIDLDTGEWVDTVHSKVASIPVIGFANPPDVEDHWLVEEMSQCFQTVWKFLDPYQLTFDLKLEVYNRIPLGKTAGEIPEHELINLIEEVCRD